MRRVRIATAAIIGVACSARGRQLAPLRVERMASFGATDGDGAIATEPRVSAHHRAGFRIIIPSAGAGGVATLPLVYGDDGRFLGTLRGGGSAAEQFQVPLFARIGPADSIWVFDGSQRALVFGPDRGYIRTVQLPVTPWDALVLPDSRVVLAPADANRPLPLLLISPTGALIREFGAPDSAAASVQAPRWLVRDVDGSFWSMPMQFRWRLEHWDSNGVALSAVERRPDWFAPYAHLTSPDQNHAPQPSIRGIWIDRADRIWVLGMAADPHWEAGLSSHRPGSLASVIANSDRVYDTVLEAINPGTTTASVFARLDPSYPSVAEPGLLVHVRQTAGGWKKAELFRITLERDPMQPR